MTKKTCAVMGAGLVGSLFSIIMKRRGYDVTLYEKRSDMRLAGADAGRSINLIVTAKGIEPLKKLNLWDEVRAITSPVKGRMMHSLEGELTYQPYGIADDHLNYSVSRSQLNVLLMNKAEEEGITIEFNKELDSIDFEKNEFRFVGVSETFHSDIIVGTDGVNSVTRKELLNISNGEEAVTMIEADYKELLMPASHDGSYAMDKDSLHIWPRGDHFLMALPNLDGSFTMTVYLNNDESETSFSAIKDEDDLQAFFEKYYSDSIPLMPDYKKEFFENPQGRLGYVKCSPWYYKDKGVLVGDAAHAIIPFFGQGMNCGFEDCYHIMRFMDEHGEDMELVFKKYFEYMKTNADAIADMAVENFVEMRDKVGDEKFLLKKRVEKLIEKKFPFYVSRYSQVVHSLTPYREAFENGLKQEAFLDELCSDITNEQELDWNKVEQEVTTRFK